MNTSDLLLAGSLCLSIAANAAIPNGVPYNLHTATATRSAPMPALRYGLLVTTNVATNLNSWCGELSDKARSARQIRR